jgi:hypothetical protein
MLLLSSSHLQMAIRPSQAMQTPASPQVEKSGDIQNVQYCRGPYRRPGFRRGYRRAIIPPIDLVIIQGIVQPIALAGTAAIPTAEVAAATITVTGSRWLPSVPVR